MPCINTRHERTNTDEVTLTLSSRHSSLKSKQLLGSSMRCLFQTTALHLSRPVFVVQTALLSKRREVVMSATVRTALDETSVTGEFKRVDAAYRNVIEKGGEFEPESLPRRLFFENRARSRCRWTLSSLYILCLSVGESLCRLSCTQGFQCDAESERQSYARIGARGPHRPLGDTSSVAEDAPR